MITLKPQWIQLFSHYVNMNQITHIEMCVYGRDCNAPFDKQDHKFMVVVLSCGQRYRIAHKDSDIENVLNKLGFDLKAVGNKNV